MKDFNRGILFTIGAFLFGRVMFRLGESKNEIEMKKHLKGCNVIGILKEVNEVEETEETNNKKGSN